MVALKDLYATPENKAAVCKTAQRHLEAAIGERVSLNTVRRWMKRMRYTRKRLSSKVLGKVSYEQVRDFLQRHFKLNILIMTALGGQSVHLPRRGTISWSTGKLDAT